MEYPVFVIFAAIVVGMYLGIRRQWASPGLIAGGGAVGSIVTMVLFMLARGTSVAQGLVLGILIGSLFAIATLSIAWYFQSNELRVQTAGGAMQHEPRAESSEEYVDS